MANFYWVGGATGTTGSYYHALRSVKAGATAFGTSLAGTTYSWINAFDFNNALNWRIYNQLGVPFQWSTPARAPSLNDTVFFASPFGWTANAPSGGLGTGSLPGGMFSSTLFLPTAKTPCLFGGAVQSAYNAVTWWGGTASGSDYTGSTYTSHLNAFVIEHSGIAQNGYQYTPQSQYPFKYLGGGLFQTLDQPIPGATQGALYDALENTIQLGWTYNGAYTLSDMASVISGLTYINNAGTLTGTGARLSILAIKTPLINSLNYSSTNPYGPGSISALGVGATGVQSSKAGRVTLHNLKNYVQVSGSSGGTGSNSALVQSSAQLKGSCEYVLSGWYSDIRRDTPEDPTIAHGWWIQNGTAYLNSPRPQLGLSGATVGYLQIGGLNQFTARVWTNYKTQIGAAKVESAHNGVWLDFQNSWNRTAVNTDLGSGLSGGTGSSSLPNLQVNLGSLPSYHGFTLPPGFNTPYVVGGFLPSTSAAVRMGVWSPLSLANASAQPQWSPGAGFTIDVNTVNVVSGYTFTNADTGIPLGITFVFTGPVNVNTLNTTSAKICSNSIMSATDKVSIGVLNMVTSHLDFKTNQNFNNWYFGVKSGFEILGGIIFQDEVSVVDGSEGIRLWNDQIVGSNFRSSSSGYGKRGTGYAGAAPIVTSTNPADLS